MLGYRHIVQTSVSFKCANSRLKSFDLHKWDFCWSSKRGAVLFIQIWLHLNQELNKCHMWLPKMSTRRKKIYTDSRMRCIYSVHALQEAIRFKEFQIGKKMCMHTHMENRSCIKDQGILFLVYLQITFFFHIWLIWLELNVYNSFFLMTYA